MMSLIDRRNTKQIVYSCDNNYVEQTIISIISMLKHNNSLIKVWIVSDNISKINKINIMNKLLIHHVDIEFLDINVVLRDFYLEEQTHHPRTIYAKLFLEQIINEDRLLYLDSDTVINDNLDYLWERDMEQELIAGVQMPYSDKVKKAMNIDQQSPYLCDGMVMLNLGLWRKYSIGRQCKEFIEQHRGNPPMMSEGTLNFVCQNRIGVLHPKYNLMPSMLMYSSDQIKKIFCVSIYYNDAELLEARTFPVVIHFIKELYNRPWLEPCDHPLKYLYRNERDKVFGNMPYKVQKLGLNTRCTRMLKKSLPFSIFAGLYHFKKSFLNGKL